MKHNREEPAYVQKEDADEYIKSQMGESIFHVFLEIASKLENIILFRLKTTCNSTHASVATLEAQTKDKELRGVQGENQK